MMIITAMTNPRICGLSILLLLSCLRTGKAFSSVRIRRGRGDPAARSFSVLRVSGGLAAPDFLSHDESSYRYLLAKARECAYSDTSTASDARAFLARILEMESGCVSGLLAGQDLCENVDEVADVVAHLNLRLREGPASLRETNGAAALGLLAVLPASLLGLLVGLVVVSTIDWKTGAVPFTFQEWVWAAKGGYLHSMIDHYIRNAGL